MHTSELPIHEITDGQGNHVGWSVLNLERTAILSEHLTVNGDQVASVRAAFAKAGELEAAASKTFDTLPYNITTTPTAKVKA